MKNIAFQLAELCPRELSGAELTMLELLCDAHEAAAKANPNASNQMAAYMGEAGVPLQSAFIGALSIIGGKHAPVGEIRKYLRVWKMASTPSPETDAAIAAMQIPIGGKVPGWGNSFYKGEPDPATLDIARFIERNRPDWHKEIAGVTGCFHFDGKMIFPNIGCYTAVVAEIIGFPDGAELALVVLPRLTTWTKLYLEAKNK